MTVDKDTLEEIEDFPQSSIGAPVPAVLSDEHTLFLCYYVDDLTEYWDGSTVKIVNSDATEQAVTVRFDRYKIYKFGPPNDEAISGHPLYKKGLRPYTIFRVANSSWTEELERMNSVHRSHDRKSFASLHHFIFVFHDSTFECVAKGMAFEVQTGSIKSIMKGLVDRL